MGRQFKAIASLTGFLCCVFSFRTARAQATPPPDWLSTQVNERGQHCAQLAEHRQTDKLLLACGAAGVWEFSLGSASPKFVRSYAFGGDVIGFVTESDGRLWVKLQVLEARPFSAAVAPSAAVFPDVASPAGSPLVPSAVTPTPAPGAPPPTRPVGRVERAAPGEVVISLGSSDGVASGNHVEFTPEGSNDGSEEVSLANEVIAVGVVTKVGSHSARVQLGLNESVPEGALASPARVPITGSLSAPPRVSGLWELGLFLRPFAALQELGGGVLFSGSVGYRFSHLHLQAVVDPLAYAAVQTKGSIGAANAAVIASYDSQYIELGFGLGVQTVNASDLFIEPGSGLAAVQLIRLGTRDGFNFNARTNIALFHSQFQFGAMVAGTQIPVTRGYWLLINGGGGNVGYAYGELGLRALLSGNGLAGSKFLTVTAGGVGLFHSGSCTEDFSGCTEEVAYGGPMLGVGGEWRF